MSQISTRSRPRQSSFFTSLLNLSVSSLCFVFATERKKERERDRQAKSNPIERTFDNRKNNRRRLWFDSFTIHASLLALNHERHSGDPRAVRTSANRFAFARRFIFSTRSIGVDWIFYQNKSARFSYRALNIAVIYRAWHLSLLPS